jgi:hypothetical protein
LRDIAVQGLLDELSRPRREVVVVEIRKDLPKARPKDPVAYVMAIIQRHIDKAKAEAAKPPPKPMKGHDPRNPYPDGPEVLKRQREKEGDEEDREACRKALQRFNVRAGRNVEDKPEEKEEIPF